MAFMRSSHEWIAFLAPSRAMPVLNWRSASREGILRVESGGFSFIIRFLYSLDRLLDLGIDVPRLFLGFFVALFCLGVILESLLRFQLAVSLFQVVAPARLSLSSPLRARASTALSAAARTRLLLKSC